MPKAPRPGKPPPFPLREGEQHVAQSPAAMVHRLGVTTGRLWLTSERVAFRPAVPLAFWVIPVFGLALWLLNRPHRRELPLSQIAATDRTSFGRNPNVLVIGTNDLSRDLKIVIDDFDAFTTELTRARKSAPKPQA